ncbi:MAG: hypothetical protein KC416_15885, partial [Myxococcales bacterium]|nr:hypothetical protein [Myxococcales bacterium]
AYIEIHPEENQDHYVALLVHEMAHQLHADLVVDESKMDPYGSSRDSPLSRRISTPTRPKFAGRCWSES